MVTFESRINGIPCLIEAQITYGHNGNQWEPPCPTEVEITIQDRRGRPAPWLARMLDQHNKTRIENEALEADAKEWKCV